MKNKIDSLLQRVGKNEVIKEHSDGTQTVRIHPILIGDVLEKIDEKFFMENGRYCGKIVRAWGNCGFTKSLQQIIEESGFKEVLDMRHNPARTCCHNCQASEQLKNHNARALLDFLINIFDEK